MRLLLYIVILAAVLVIPNHGTDVGRLIPVEVVAVSETAGSVIIRTDTGNEGKGGTLEKALRDLKETAPGIIYLDTAEYLLMENGMDALQQAGKYLKGNTKVYLADETIPLEGIANYLSVHESPVRLKDVSESNRLPTIAEENGRYRIMEK